MFGWYKITTNLREFQIEAAGIGDAIDRAVNLILVKDRGEKLLLAEFAGKLVLAEAA